MKSFIDKQDLDGCMYISIYIQLLFDNLSLRFLSYLSLRSRIGLRYFAPQVVRVPETTHHNFNNFYLWLKMEKRISINAMSS